MNRAKNVQHISDELLAFGGKDAAVLERFMKEFFPYSAFKKIGFFTKEIRGNYYAQAKRVCVFFGYKTVFEYGAKEIRFHLSYGSGETGIGSDERPLHVDEQGKLYDEPFITVIPSIYE